MLKYILFILILIAGCSPTKRHSRIVKKFPYVHTIDSVTLIDTVTIKTNLVYKDTATLIESLRDTITIVKDNLKVKVYTVKDSFYLEAKCDTVFFTKVITRTVPVKYWKESNFNYWWLMIPSALLIVILLRRK